MKAGDKFQQPSLRVNELWQTDFTYFKIVGWGWYYLSTVLDDYSRFIANPHTKVPIPTALLGSDNFGFATVNWVLIR
jgi:transposase InsO family protein